MPAKGALAEENNLFSLTSANDENVLLMRYAELDVTFQGQMISKVAFWWCKTQTPFSRPKRVPGYHG